MDMKKGILTLCAAVAICIAGVASADPLNDEIDARLRAGGHGSLADQLIEARHYDDVVRKAAAGHAARCAGGRITIGMSAAIVMAHWCEPDHINSTITPAHNLEQWVYGNSNFLYFEDGTLVGIQRRTP